MIGFGGIYQVRRKIVGIIEDIIVETEVEAGDSKVTESPDSFVNLATFNNMKREHDGELDIYGAWQIALANNYIKNPGHYLLLSDEDNGSIVTFERSNKKSLRPVSQSKYINGSANHHGLKCNDGDLPSSVVRLDIDPEKIKLPKVPLLLDAERISEKKKESRKKWKKSISFFVFTCIALLIGKIYSENLLETSIEKSKELESEIQILSENLRNKQKVSIDEFPSNSILLTGALRVLDLDKEAETNGKADLSNGELKLYVDGSISDQLRFIYYGVRFVRHPSRKFEARITND